jgi:hypothetical protein
MIPTQVVFVDILYEFGNHSSRSSASMDIWSMHNKQKQETDMQF